MDGSPSTLVFCGCEPQMCATDVRRQMAGCQFSPEVSLREKIAVDYATVVTSQPTHSLDCPHHPPHHS